MRQGVAVLVDWKRVIEGYVRVAATDGLEGHGYAGGVDLGGDGDGEAGHGG